MADHHASHDASLPTVRLIDGVNYGEARITTANGEITVQGLTVRALRHALELCDPDAIVIYVAEMPDRETAKDVDLLIGIIAGVGIDANNANDAADMTFADAMRPPSSRGVVSLFGPEAADSLMENMNVIDERIQ